MGREAGGKPGGPRLVWSVIGSVISLLCLSGRGRICAWSTI